MSKPNCYDCKWRQDIPGDAHSQCVHPRITPEDRIIAPFATMSGMVAPVMKRLNVMGDPAGIRNGWFMWPLNFDPVWLKTCEGFEKKGGDETHETTKDQ